MQLNGYDLKELFRACLNAEYITVEGGGSFALERRGDTLFVFFEKSDGAQDWLNNLDFSAVAVPYGNMEREWYCHGGFLRVWKSILPYIKGAVLDLEFRGMVAVGYSHGAALSLLCHEYIWYNRPDLRGRVFSYAFGCPRVIFGKADKAAERWQNFYVIRNIDDIVTHLPPKILGFRHVGKIIRIGKRGKYSKIDAHRQESYLDTLEGG